MILSMRNLNFKLVLVLCVLVCMSEGYRFRRLLYLPIPPELVSKADFQTSLFLITINLFVQKNAYIQAEHLWIEGQELKKTFNELGDFLSGINNLVIGNENSVEGSGNRVLVDNVVVKGSGGWVLKRCFQGTCQGDLIMGQFRIKLDKIDELKTNPGAVIDLISPPDSSRLTRL